ncbi:a-pheromone receptor PreA [Aspergillus sclerotioniger CBS 115572]|uniref:A-pheromone receptor PreA n=1 Tax=Aspergillus sclerotioniger CBS 115572 TaxID=1450535 RepID=A0A317WYG7_9EURO|nr:a-pheromone receptor PreA [Aspergillus sclerotioniger CBS 115572]PWY91444.1 a-pheromone receptor PreA [Aspergillus sclerotioniger CBS 115572]
MAPTAAPLYPEAILVPVLSFISMLLSIVPLVLHWKNRNFAASSLICWYLVLNLFNIINALIWPTDDDCDVEAKIMIGSYIVIPGTLVCIFRNLAHVLDTSLMVLLFCVIAPVIAMLTHYIYQRGRYFLFAIAGCFNSYDQSWVTLALAWIWPLIICLIAAYYCVLVLHRLAKYRSQFGDILQSANSNLTKPRFMRLFLPAFVMLWAILPVQTYVVSTNIIRTQPWHPYSWSTVHSQEWDKVIKVPTGGHVFYDRWIPVASGYVFCIFFGSGRDASKMYCTILGFLGFGYFFTSLQSSTANGSYATGSTGSRAKLLFHKTWTTTTRTHVNSSVDAARSAHVYRDIEKGATSRAKQSKLASWYRRPWFSQSRHPSSSQERMVALHHMPEPTTTVSTNAWAGVSQSRGSSDIGTTPLAGDHIRVKQVISQESEVQV